MFISTKVFACAAALLASAVSAAPAAAFDYPYNVRPDADVSIVKSTVDDTTVSCFRYTCVHAYKISVDVAVRNKAYKKTVGVRWTKDNWASNNETAAAYVRALDNGFELWNLNIDAGDNAYAFGDGNRFYDFSLSAYASFDAAPRVWDPVNNYGSLAQGTPAKPIAAIGGKVESENGKVVLHGAVRAWVFDGQDVRPESLTVRWSADGWKTWKDTPAQKWDIKEHLFTFAIPTRDVAANGQHDPHVSYTAKYSTPNGDFWLPANVDVNVWY